MGMGMGRANQQHQPTNQLTICRPPTNRFTLNEPWSTAVLGHGLGNHAPGIKDQVKATYEAAHNQLLAHAAAAKVRTYVRICACASVYRPCVWFTGLHRIECMNGRGVHLLPLHQSRRPEQVYREKYQKKQKGKIGIVLSTQFKEPQCDTNPADVAAAERNLHFYLGWFAAPIFKVRTT